MGLDYIRKRVSIAFRNCFRSASRRPLLVFMACVLYLTHQLFPALFSLLVYASPVIASTLILLGTLLFYGHANAPQIQKEPTSHHHEIHNLVFGGMGNNEIDEETYLVHNVNINDAHKFGSLVKQEAKSELSNRKPVLVARGGQFQSFGTGNVRSRSNDGSRRSSFDPHYSVLGHFEDDNINKGWETGSSASASDMFPMLDGIHPLMQSGEINETDDDDHHYDHEHIEIKDDDDDDDEENGITWSEDHRNLVNFGTLEIERNERLESLIARQKAIKNMRLMAEKNMVNIIDTHISTSRNTPFGLPNNIIPRRNSIDVPYDPRPGPTLQTNHASGHRQRRSDIGIAGHTTLDPYPVHVRIGSETTSIGSTHTSGINEHIVPRRRFSENYDAVKVHQAAKGDNRSNDVKKGGENKGYEDKTSNKLSSSSFCDVTDDINDGDDEKEEFGSIENSLTPKSKDLQDLENTGDTDSDNDTDSDTQEAGLSQRLKSWFGWKA